jgi:hypothetical protein
MASKRSLQLLENFLLNAILPFFVAKGYADERTATQQLFN